MIITIALKEMLTTVRTVRFAIIVLVACLLMPLSSWVLSNDYLSQLSDYEDRVNLEARRVDGKNMKMSVGRPVPPLSPLFRGVSKNAANSVELRYFLGWNYPGNAGVQSITDDIFPTVDLTFIIGIVMSVLALMLSFDAISGEKVQATLRLMMANSLPRSSIVIGKWLGLSMALLAPFLVGFLLSVIIYTFASGIVLVAADWAALAIAFLLSSIFLMLFIALGITISSFTTDPTISIFVSLGIWGLLVIILPQIAMASASEIKPLRPVQSVERDIRLIYNETAMGMRTHNMALVEEAKRMGTPFSEVNRVANIHDFEMAKDNMLKVNSLEREYWLQTAEQEEVGMLLSLFSPYGSFSKAMISLAATDPESQRLFLIQAYEYGAKFYPSIWDQAFNTEQTWTEIFDAYPTFAFRGESLMQRLDRVLLPAAILMLMSILLVMVSVIRFNAYDVR
jgi:ABC-type transport system involved in multi-copper enzyme maturation permease subunit